MLNTKSLLNDIFISTCRGIGYTIFDHDDKTWIMPDDSLRLALDMYQPSTFKGKVLKKMVFYCNKLTFFSEKLGIEHTNLMVNDDVLKYIYKCVGKENIYIAGYMGDTSSKQNNKATLQIYDEHNLLCYAKITKESEVAENFKHEILSLKFLEEKGIKNVPQILGEEIIDGMHIFIQSTRKPLHEKVKLQFGKKQINFVKEIVDKTKTKLKYENTDFYKAIQYLKTKTNDFSTSDKTVLESTISTMEKELTKKPLEYSFFHGDYTPWNVYYCDGVLNAFDFEYCSFSMPCYMDVFHYLSQLYLLGCGNDVEKTLRRYNQNKDLLLKYMENPDFIYLCYLLFIVSFYKKRTDETKTNISNKYEKWIALMEYLNERLQ
jgi:hypothetical protein